MKLGIGGLGLGIIPTAARPVPTTAPVNVAPPVITGVLTQGQTLTANPGSWSGLPSGAFAYQWQRNGTNIGGATNATYVAQASDVSAGAAALTVEVTATNDLGSTTAESTGVTIAPPLSISGTPGAASVGISYSFTPTLAGGHAPYTVTFGGTYPAGITKNASTGALGGTPTTSGTASGLTMTVTDADGLTSVLGPFALTVTSGAVPQVAPILEDFAYSATGAGFNGHANSPYGGKGWTLASTQGTADLTSPSADGDRLTGNETGGGTTAKLRTLAFLDPGAVVPQRRFSFHIDPSHANGYVNPPNTSGGFPSSGTTINGLTRFHLNGDVTNHARLELAVTRSTNGGDWTMLMNTGGDLGGTLTGSTTLFNTSSTIPVRALGLEYGDTVTIVKRTDGAALYYDLEVNGTLVKLGTVDVNTASGGVPVINDCMGFSGSTQTMLKVDDMVIADAANDGWISVDHPGRIAEVKFWDDSSTYVKLTGRYGGTAPPALYATVRDVTTPGSKTNVTGYVDVALSNFVASGGVWSGSIDIAAVSTPAWFDVKVERHDLVSDARVPMYTPRLRRGFIFMGYGQSLMAQSWQNTASGVTISAMLNSFTVNGSDEVAVTGVADVRRRIGRPITDTINGFGGKGMTFGQHTLENVISGTPGWCAIQGGHGGQDAIERDIGTNCFEATKEGIRLAGGLGIVIDNTGTFEINNANSHYPGGWTPTYAAAWKTRLCNWVRAWEAAAGHRIRMILAGPPAMESVTNNANAHAYYRTVWELCTKNGGQGDFTDGFQRFYLGNPYCDLQGNGSDIYHKSNGVDGYPEMWRRYAYQIAKVAGVTSVDRIGPSIASVSKQSSTVIRVTFNLNGADDISLTNAAAAGTALGGSFASGDFRGGMTFASDSAFASELIPTAATKGTAAAGQNYIDFTFASLPSTTYVRGPYGQNPFNRTNNATIKAAMMTAASKIVGTYSADVVGYSPPLQMWFNPASAVNDVTADYLTAA